jgi:hypothetical protein
MRRMWQDGVRKAGKLRFIQFHLFLDVIVNHPAISLKLSDEIRVNGLMREADVDAGVRELLAHHKVGDFSQLPLFRVCTLMP